MIISKTPFRISFFGGGTDYPAWLKENNGAVLATTIDKYCYITLRTLPPFFEYKSRISYSAQELVNKVDEINHPSVRECLKFMRVNQGIEIHHDGDLPARTGLGSSSSFTVGLLHSLFALKGEIASQTELAKLAIHVEQNLIKENVGCQDQILAAFGGFNLVELKVGNDFRVSPIVMPAQRLNGFQSHLMLIFTGFSRIASEIARKLVKKTAKKKTELKTMHSFVYEAIKILNGKSGLKDFGRLLHENWKLKRSLTDNITTPVIDDLYAAAMKAGALGGKVLGAGGGGFMLIYAEPQAQPRIKKALKKFLHVPFNFEGSGSQIIFYKPDENWKS